MHVAVDVGVDVEAKANANVLCEQECIPVGCVPPSVVAVPGGVSTSLRIQMLIQCLGHLPLLEKPKIDSFNFILTRDFETVSW